MARKAVSREHVAAMLLWILAIIMLVRGAADSFHMATADIPVFDGSGGGGRTEVEVEHIEMVLPRRPWNRSAMLALRTAFHFQPAAHWMNAPLYHDGWYHLFYQYNPEAAYWGRISWGHAVSRDMVRWRYVQELAMVPDHWYDAAGVWTGSATKLPDGSPAILYTGSSHTPDAAQLQNLAIPSDHLLVHWTKSPHNPVIYPPHGLNVTDFRDPSSAWLHANGETATPNNRSYSWIVAVGSQNRSADRTGFALLYRSSDFVSWQPLPLPLHSVEGTGMWECVDFFPVLRSGSPEGVDSSVAEGDQPPTAVKHVLKVSVDDAHVDYYVVGEYGDADGSPVFVPENREVDIGRGYRYDLGNYYASKSFFDPVKRRRVLFGWVNESDTREDDIAKGWAGVQGIPRHVWFDNQTQESLIQWPIEEIMCLYESNITFSNITLESGSIMRIEEAQGAQWDITMKFKKPLDDLFLSTFKLEHSPIECNENGANHIGIFGPFGIFILSSHDLQERTGVYFYLYPLLSENGEISWKTVVCNDLTRSSLASNLDNGVYGGRVIVLDKEFDLTLRILVDHSIIETFAQGGRTTITSRVYPTLALNESANLFIFNGGSMPIVLSHFEAWKLSSINLHDYTT